MEKLPFTTFDFWGYLAAGFLLLCAVDAAAGLQLLGRPNWTVIEGILAISMAYVTGHVAAGVSSLLLERLLVGRWLGWPREVLFGLSKQAAWVQRLLAFYYAPLPQETRTAILTKAKASNIEGPGDALFWLAFSKARGNAPVLARLNDFLNQYSFCRNVALVALVDAILLYWAYLQPKAPESHLLWSRIALFVGLAMTVRYLKFLRHYALELFTNFAHTEESIPKIP